MKQIAIGITTAAVFFIAGEAAAAIIEIRAQGPPAVQYNPDSIQVAAGDTVRWIRISSNHSVTSGTGIDDPGARSLFNADLTVSAPTFIYQFNTPGTYSYFCIEHSDPEFGLMTGKVVVTVPVDRYISTTAELFTEDSVQIAPGETIEFYNGTGEHTLTNGTGSTDPNAGNTINSVLGTTIPAIQITFSSVGVYPFFCVPHELNGMFATVYVVEPVTCACDCHADPVCDQVINNAQDVIVTINVAFRGAAAVTDPNIACPNERTDVNCDGFTSAVDVVKVINVSFRGANTMTEYCQPCP